MQLNKLNDSYTVSDQITIDDIETIKQQGFKTIICHRPDDEEPNQPSVDSIKKIAEECGLHFVHQPVVGSQLNMNDVADFQAYYEAAEKPVFAYCRSGMRSCTLWALSNVGIMESNEIIEATSKAGYNLSHLIK